LRVLLVVKKQHCAVQEINTHLNGHTEAKIFALYYSTWNKKYRWNRV